MSGCFYVMCPECDAVPAACVNRKYLEKDIGEIVRHYVPLGYRVVFTTNHRILPVAVSKCSCGLLRPGKT